MPRLKFRRISIIFVAICFGYFVVLYWTSYVLNSGGKHRLKYRSDFIVDASKSRREIDNEFLNDPVGTVAFDKDSLKVVEEPEGYSLEYLAQLNQINTPEDQRKYDEGYHLHSFNQYISDKLSYIRPIPDARNALCQKKVYDLDLPSASIVICFHNEALSALLRTVHSVLHRTPPHLVHEIILVNDASEFEYLETELSDYVKHRFPKVRLIHSKERLGLIRARMLGSHNATGEVLVFLDSHCEVGTRWLEPLLTRIKDDRRNVAVPIIDIINADTFAYEAASVVKGGFNWGMHFKWDSMPKSYFLNKATHADPITSPTMAGGLFAMDRSYFHELGEYDPGMDVWGGENLEISFRVWMCGGRLEIIPCSRVAHIFRKRRPYGSPNGDSFLKNSLRVALVWMDGYKKYFFQTRPGAETGFAGDITERVELRQRLKCKSFKWYLDNVYPEQTLPASVDPIPMRQRGEMEGKNVNFSVHTKQKGQLKHLGSGLCVRPEKGIYDKRSLLMLAVCNVESKEQLWYETSGGDFRLANLLCLDVEEGAKPFARLMHCNGGVSQIWNFSLSNGVQTLRNVASHKCLVATGTEPGSQLRTSTCTSHKLQNFQLLSI